MANGKMQLVAVTILVAAEIVVVIVMSRQNHNRSLKLRGGNNEGDDHAILKHTQAK